MSRIDDFDLSGFKLRMGEPVPVGGSWSGEGDTIDFVVTTEVVGAFDLTALTFPVHDPPVAWTVTDHPLARLGFPVIAAPGYRHPEPVVAGAATYMDPQPLILDGEPGRRP